MALFFAFKCMAKQSKKIAILTIAILIYWLPSISYAEENHETKRVLILHWQDAYEEIPMIMDRSLKETLEKDTEYHIEYYTEYLNFSKFTSDEVQGATIDLLRKKYTKLKLDAVITTELADYYFFIEHRAELFPSVPLIFSALNESIDTSLGIPPNATGNFKAAEVDTTIKLIKKIQPEISNLVFVVGSGQVEALYYRFIKNSMLDYADDYTTTYTIDMSFEEIRGLLKQLPEHTAVIYTGMYTDAKGKGLNPGDALASLSENCTAPIYVFSDAFLNENVVGGNLISYELTGRDLAERALAIFHGKKAEEIPTASLKSVYKFNWTELNKWDIKETTLPKGSVVMGKPTVDQGQSGLEFIYFILGICSVLLVSTLHRFLKR